MTNATMTRFGYPGSLIREFRHWVVLLRPTQVTLGSLVLAAKSDSLALGALPAEAHCELAPVSRQIEATLAAVVGYDKINYLMLMMVDPHVHFHVFPRYPGSRETSGTSITDHGWPGPPDLQSAVTLDPPVQDKLRQQLAAGWISVS